MNPQQQISFQQNNGNVPDSLNKARRQSTTGLSVSQFHDPNQNFQHRNYMDVQSSNFGNHSTYPRTVQKLPYASNYEYHSNNMDNNNNNNNSFSNNQSQFYEQPQSYKPYSNQQTNYNYENNSQNANRYINRQEQPFFDANDFADEKPSMYKTQKSKKRYNFDEDDEKEVTQEYELSSRKPSFALKHLGIRRVSQQSVKPQPEDMEQKPKKQLDNNYSDENTLQNSKKTATTTTTIFLIQIKNNKK